MERYRGDRDGGLGGGRNPRMQSRWSSGSPSGPHHRYPNHSRGGGGEGFSGGGEGGRYHPYRHPNDFPPPPGGPGGGGEGGGGGRYDGGQGFRGGPSQGFENQMHAGGGPRRDGGSGGVGGFSRGGSFPDYKEGSNYVKLFVGSVPRTATEDQIRPLFEEHGEVIEVALIKDKRTGQQQGCCFIKYATSEEAQRAIRALHNQVTLPGGTGPIQVRFADGERERLGTVEHKLFVGSLNKQATEKEIEQIFAPYGHVEDVYIMRDEMKQSRGCCFVKFSSREMAVAAMNALHGTYVMRGCEQPLIVRFADPKRPRPGESRGGPAFGGPGIDPRSQLPFSNRSTPNFGEQTGGHIQANAWPTGNPMSGSLSSQANTDGFGNNLPGGAGFLTPSTAALENMGLHGGPVNGSFSGMTGRQSSTPQGLPPVGQMQTVGQQVSPAQKPLTSPQQQPPPFQQQHNQQVLGSQVQTLPAPVKNFGPQSVGISSCQAMASPQVVALGSQLSSQHPLMYQNAPNSTSQPPIGMQQQGISGVPSQQQLPTSTIPQLPIQQLPSQLSQALLQQQAQALQSSFQSSQQAISQLQQQLQLMHQSNLNPQQGSPSKQQSQWTRGAPQSGSSAAASTPANVIPAAMSAAAPPATGQPATPLSCNWTEHTSPQGFKYYYNSVTKESKWEKPEELTLFEQQQQQKLLLLQQQQQKLAAQQLQLPSQPQPHMQLQSSQQVSQVQQIPAQIQHTPAQRQQTPTQMQQTPLSQVPMNQQPQLQFVQPSLPFRASAGGHQTVQDFNYVQLQAAGSGADPARAQGVQPSQEWWKNKP